MDIKEEMKECISGYLKDVASFFFLRRALVKIDEAEADRTNLLAASGKVAKMIRLFIDEKMAEEVMTILSLKIEKAGHK